MVRSTFWAPAATVTFDLNTPGVTNPTFADGTTVNKTALAMRKSSCNRLQQKAPLLLPADPYASGQEFDGWYYTDAAGTEHQFTLIPRSPLT